jgi:hypothetical protein
MSGRFVNCRSRLQTNGRSETETSEGRKDMTQGGGNSREAKVLCSRCFKEVMAEQIAVEDKGKKEFICYLCTEALKHKRDE